MLHARFRSLFVCFSIIALAGVVAMAYTAFSLSITFAGTDVNDNPYKLTAISDASFVDRAEGRAPAVLMSKSGNIELDTRGSTRTLCFNFDAPPVEVQQPSVAPTTGCYPVLLRTLIPPEGPVASLFGGESRSFSMDVYWTGHGTDNRLHDYVLEYKRAQPFNSGIWVSASADLNSWTVDQIGFARVSIYRTGKGAGWSAVGTYDMPFHFTALRAVPSAR